MLFTKKLVRMNYVMKISVHQLVNNVHIIEGLPFGGSYDILDANDLWKMIEILSIQTERTSFSNVN